MPSISLELDWYFEKPEKLGKWRNYAKVTLEKQLNSVFYKIKIIRQLPDLTLQIKVNKKKSVTVSEENNQNTYTHIIKNIYIYQDKRKRDHHWVHFKVAH